MRTKRFHAIVEHASTGFQLPETLARKIDDLSRNLPRDFTYRRIARKTDSFTLDAGERTDVSVITTDALDREGEVILPAGGDWRDYNRVVTFAHRYDQLPAGSNWWIRARGNGLVAKTHYPDRPKDWGDAPWLPSAILHLMQQPVPTCTGKSIGFLPLSVRPPTNDEIAKRPQIKNAAVIDRWVGVEYAVVPVPCNPEAEMQAVAKGLALGLIDQKTLSLIHEAAGQWSGSESGTGGPPVISQGPENYGRGATRLSSPKSRAIEDLHAQIVRQIHDTFRQLTGRIC